MIWKRSGCQGEGCPEGTVLELSPKRVSSPNAPSCCSVYDYNTPGLASFCRLVMRTESLSGLCISYSYFRVWLLARCPSAPWHFHFRVWCEGAGLVRARPSRGGARPWGSVRLLSFVQRLSWLWAPHGFLSPLGHSGYRCASWHFSRPCCPICRPESASWAEGPGLRAECVPLRPADFLVQGRVTCPCRGFWLGSVLLLGWGISHFRFKFSGASTACEARGRGRTFSPQGPRPPHSLAMGGSI